jgi:glycosyltransferase involved in cell wall biosynthesis
MIGGWRIERDDSNNMPRLIYLVNIPRFFVSHRLPLAQAARDAGYEVHVAASALDQENVAAIEAAGFPFHTVAISQHGTNIFNEIASVRSIYQLYQSLKPDIVHQITVKPILYGGIASRLLGVPAVVNAVTGLGFVFTTRSVKWSLIRAATKIAYRVALEHPNARTIFQNPDDRERFARSRMLRRENTVVIKGSGVDMAQFRPQPEADGAPVILFAGRLLWQKGAGEFVEAARRFHAAGIPARFVIVGYSEPSSPSAVPGEQLESWNRSGLIEWWGRCTNMPEVYAQSHIVCLPSSYGEGVPKVLIEAAACGRAIVTTNTPGCREITRDGENGLLVPTENVDALYEALKKLVEDPVLRQQMGTRGRQIAEAEFSLDRICGETLALYAQLLRS